MNLKEENFDKSQFDYAKKMLNIKNKFGNTFNYAHDHDKKD